MSAAAFSPNECPSRKAVFGSKKHARAKARRVLDEHGASQVPYRCRDCGAWHLTSSQGRSAIETRKAKAARRREQQIAALRAAGVPFVVEDGLVIPADRYLRSLRDFD